MNNKDRTESHKRRIMLGAFAKSVKKAGKLEWFITTLIITAIGGLLSYLSTKYFKLDLWVFLTATGVFLLLGIYVGYEIYLARLVKGNELKSYLELSSLVGHVIEKIDRLEQALIQELDIVIGIKKDVVKDEEEKEKVKTLSAKKIKQEIDEKGDEGMTFKFCPSCNEDVYVAKSMDLCPFCWNSLEVSEEEIEEAEEAETAEAVEADEVLDAVPDNSSKNKDDNNVEEIIFD